MEVPWFGLVLGILATWRLAHLLAHEDGPWDLMLRLRVALGDGTFGRLLDCFYCVSLWVALPISLAVGRNALECGLAWLALSGAACLLERRGQVPLQMQNLSNQGDEHELLRGKADGPAETQPVGVDP
jgi:hypothetical protein